MNDADELFLKDTPSTLPGKNLADILKDDQADVEALKEILGNPPEKATLGLLKTCVSELVMNKTKAALASVATIIFIGGAATIALPLMHQPANKGSENVEKVALDLPAKSAPQVKPDNAKAVDNFEVVSASKPVRIIEEDKPKDQGKSNESTAPKNEATAKPEPVKIEIDPEPKKSEAKSSPVAADNAPVPQIETKIAAGSEDTSKSVQAQPVVPDTQTNVEITPEKVGQSNSPSNPLSTENHKVVEAVAVPLKKEVAVPPSDANISMHNGKTPETPIDAETNNVIDQYAFGSEVKDQSPSAPETDKQPKPEQKTEAAPVVQKSEVDAPKDESPKKEAVPLDASVEYRIIDRKGEQAGFRRMKNNDPKTTQWFLVIEAVNKQGNAIPVHVQSMDTGDIKEVKKWAVQVSEQDFKHFSDEKMKQGKIPDLTIGVAPNDHTPPQWSVQTTGSMITEW